MDNRLLHALAPPECLRGGSQPLSKDLDEARRDVAELQAELARLKLINRQQANSIKILHILAGLHD